MSTRRTILFLRTALVCCLACTSCTSRDREESPRRTPFAESDPTQPGPVVPTPTEESFARTEEVVPAEPAVEFRETRVFEKSESPDRRDDGRPVWWFGRSIDRDGATVLCEETLGTSIRDVRRAAISKIEQAAPGIARSRGWVEFAIDYERIWIWPAPNTGRTETAYAGYIMARVAVNTIQSE